MNKLNSPQQRSRFYHSKNNRLQKTWQGRQDLNLRHPVLETGALPTELLPFIPLLGYKEF